MMSIEGHCDVAAIFILIAMVADALDGRVARALHTAAVPAPVQAGQVVLADVCGTGVAVVATKNIG